MAHNDACCPFMSLSGWASRASGSCAVPTPPVAAGRRRPVPSETSTREASPVNSSNPSGQLLYAKLSPTARRVRQRAWGYPTLPARLPFQLLTRRLSAFSSATMYPDARRGILELERTKEGYKARCWERCGKRRMLSRSRGGRGQPLHPHRHGHPGTSRPGTSFQERQRWGRRAM